MKVFRLWREIFLIISFQIHHLTEILPSVNAVSLTAVIGQGQMAVISQGELGRITCRLCAGLTVVISKTFQDPLQEYPVITEGAVCQMC